MTAQGMYAPEPASKLTFFPTFEFLLYTNKIPSYRWRNQGARKQSRCCFSHGCQTPWFLQQAFHLVRDTGRRDPVNLAACCRVKWDPVPLPGLLLLLQWPRGVQLGDAGERRLPWASVQALSPAFYFISLRGLGRNNVIASPLGNTAFLCHGNVYPVQTGEFWLWGRSETHSRNDLVKKKGRCVWKKRWLQLWCPASPFSLPPGNAWAFSPLLQDSTGRLGE